MATDSRISRCEGLLGPVLLLVALLACGSTKMSATGEAKATPREPNCEFDILTADPAADYTEIAVIDVQPGGYGHNRFTEISDFKEEIRPHVCEAGGDAAIALANGHGVYIKATVLRRIQTVPSLQAPPPPPVQQAAAPAPASAPPAAAAGGCEYDTQCKGDRICVDGECQSPEAPTPAPEAAPAPAK